MKRYFRNTCEPPGCRLAAQAEALVQFRLALSHRMPIISVEPSKISGSHWIALSSPSTPIPVETARPRWPRRNTPRGTLAGDGARLSRHFVPSRHLDGSCRDPLFGVGLLVIGFLYRSRRRNHAAAAYTTGIDPVFSF